MGNNGAMRELPKYSCHKIVWALQIKEIIDQTSEALTDGKGPKPDGAMITPFENDYAPFRVSQEYLDKFKPEIGGYYVQYQDGYKSFSPAKAFEDGYTLIK